MTDPIYAYEDFQPGMEISFGTYEVTADEIRQFAQEFDPQPMHLDEEAASAGVLGGLSASGWHTASMCMRLMCDGFILKSTSQGAPGVDYLNWKRPVMAGDTLTGKAIILSKRRSASRPTLGFVQVKSEFSNQRGEVVCEMENAGIMGVRDPETAA